MKHIRVDDVFFFQTRVRVLIYCEVLEELDWEFEVQASALFCVDGGFATVVVRA